MELSAVRNRLEISEHERYEVDNLQSQVDDMREEMIKTDCLEMWGKDMEGGITTVLSILDYRMRKLELGRGMMAGDSSVKNETPSPEIVYLEKKWEGELR